MAVADKYGLTFNPPISELEVELYCFRHSHSPDRGGLGRFEHFQNAANIIWPDLIWNEWLERQIESLCEHDWVSWTGCAASGKTFGSALYALVWWLANPCNSTVILTSTTAKMIRKRAWSNISHLWRTASGTLCGNMVDSKTTLQSVKGDDKNAIYAVAVLDGATSKAVANIQGIHTERVLAIIDEATDTPEAAFEAASNLSKGCSEFQMLAIGNPHSKLDEHGRFSEPKLGWDIVTPDLEEWETDRGICVRFDGTKSPNIKAGKTKYEFLITAEQMDQSIRYEGEASPKFWKYVKGLWAPDGVCRTVLSETLCQKYRVTDTHTFQHKARVIAGLDPAFGGDRCVLRFARYGDLEGGLMGVQFDEILTIKLDVTSKEPIHYQIANKVRDACTSKGCDPSDLAVDATGEGGGLCDIMAKEWSNKIRRIEFGGKPSELPVSAEDSRPASEAYANRVTELWWSVREWVIREQIRGMERETIIEFCQRMFDDSKRKICIERKIDMKARTGQSPDLADAAALVVEVARQLGAGRLNKKTEADKEWENAVREHDMIYTEDALYASLDY